MSFEPLNRIILDYRKILLVGLPLAFNNLSSIAINVGDTLMIARFSEIHLAAIAIGSSVWISLFLFGLGLIMAIGPLVAQFFGANNFAAIKPIISQGFIIASIIALIIFFVMRNFLPIYLTFGIDSTTAELAQAYLKGLSIGVFPAFYYHVLKQVSEGMGRTVPILIVMVCCLPINLTLNYLFIYGGAGIPALGVEGCGFGSGIVFWIMFGLLLTYSKFISAHRVFYSDYIPSTFDRIRLQTILKLGYPIGFSLCLQTGLFSVLTLIVGRLGTIQASAHQIVLNYSGFVFMVPLGLSMAITVCVGQLVGKGELNSSRRLAFHGILLCLIISILGSCISFFYPSLICSIYTDVPEVQNLAIPLLKIAAFVQIGDAMQTAASFALRGMKDTKIPMIMNFMSYWVVGFSTSYILGVVLGYGTQGVWLGLTIALFSAGICQMLRLVYLTREFERSH